MRSFIALTFSALFAVLSQAQTLPALLISDAHALASLKASYEASRSPADLPEAKRMIRAAQKALKMEPVSVTSKKEAPAGGTVHDYVSLAPYWWPDPAKKDGLPYIRRDGEVNPERERYMDREHFRKLVPGIETLARAFYLTGEERYAGHAARLISAWFLDSSTAMNPSLNFAQAIRGRNDGRGAGLIEMHMLPRILDATVLLEGSKAWTPAKHEAMRQWCARYYTWLTTSPIGLDEFDAPNNHGSWYDVQRAAIALYIGKTEEARHVLEEAKTRRIAAEIEPDGTQPKELVRTKAMGYSTFNLIALTTLATIGSSTGVDLWHYTTKDGRGIQKAIDYMAPYYAGEKKWDRMQIAPFDWNDALEMLKKASPHYGGAYDAIIAKIERTTDRTR